MYGLYSREVCNQEAINVMIARIHTVTKVCCFLSTSLFIKMSISFAVHLHNLVGVGVAPLLVVKNDFNPFCFGNVGC